MFCIICIMVGFCKTWFKKDASEPPPSIFPKSAEPNPPRPPLAALLAAGAGLAAPCAAPAVDLVLR
jgi:hypothetical protein